jgi:hypothetical protein
MPKIPRRPKPGPRSRKDRDLRGSGLSSEGSGQSDLAVWRDGVGLTLIPTLFGLWPLITGHFALRTRGGQLALDGAPARALGLAGIALGACVLFHFFWAARERFASYSQPAQVAAALAFVGALGFIAYATLS